MGKKQIFFFPAISNPAKSLSNLNRLGADCRGRTDLGMFVAEIVNLGAELAGSSLVLHRASESAWNAPVHTRNASVVGEGKRNGERGTVKLVRLPRPPLLLRTRIISLFQRNRGFNARGYTRRSCKNRRAKQPLGWQVFAFVTLHAND